MSAAPQIIVDEARIRVLTFLTIFALGGTEKQVVSTTERFDRTRFEPEFACFKRRGQLLEQVLGTGAPVTEFPVTSFFRLQTVRQQFALARHLQRRHVQVMHSYNFYANVFALPAARFAGVPCIVASVRDTGVYLSPLQRRVHRAALSLADRILVNAEAVRDWLAGEGVDPARIVVVPNGLDADAYARRRGATSFRQELGLGPDARLVVVLARLNREKGLDCFVDAAARIAPQFPDTHFVVVGGDLAPRADGSIPGEIAYRQELDERARRAGIADRVHFTGFREDVPNVLAETALSVLPSFSEGLSNTLLESMAAGVPIVATAVGGTPEVVEDGRCGLLVPPRDAGALADAMARVLGNELLAARLADAGRKRAVERHSFASTVAATQDLYLNILGAKHGDH